ncbi:MAG: ribosomal-protein-alanine N-acetyltransferase [Aureispira sp.]|jgi:ribosomal-protein-alanine N-acetyltransferase
MEKIIETERLILREVNDLDQEGLFDLDSKPEVHQYIGTKPLIHIDQALDVVRRLQSQYKKNGIGRWAVIDKLSQEFLGWSGLKLWDEPLNNQYPIYELGYRFIPKYWGKGYATESAKAWVDYAFELLNVNTLYAITDPENINSKRVLQKVGFIEGTPFNFEGEQVSWFELPKSNWVK